MLEDIFTLQFFLILTIMLVLQIMPIRMSRWAAALVCAAVFIHEGQVFAFFAALAFGAVAAQMEVRHDAT